MSLAPAKKSDGPRVFVLVSAIFGIGIASAGAVVDDTTVRSSLWQLIETRRAAGSEEKGSAVTDSAKSSPKRQCIIDGVADVLAPPVELPMLTMMLQSPVRYNAIRSAKDGVRFNLELFVSADSRWTGRGTWFSASFDRGWSSSQRTLTDLSVPDRYQVEDWSYRQQLRSGIPQGEPEFEHEAEVWKKKGPCPPGIKPGFVTDKEMEKAAGEAPPVVVPRP